jgi:hypothetical protein
MRLRDQFYLEPASKTAKNGNLTYGRIKLFFSSVVFDIVIKLSLGTEE